MFAGAGAPHIEDEPSSQEEAPSKKAQLILMGMTAQELNMLLQPPNPTPEATRTFCCTEFSHLRSSSVKHN